MTVGAPPPKPMPENVATNEVEGDTLLGGLLQRAMDQLPDGMRQVLILHDVEGYTHDEIGEVFGRARPATGFSADLKTLIRLGVPPSDNDRQGILAPWSEDPPGPEAAAEA